MTQDNKPNAANPAGQVPASQDFPVESGRKILLNWIIVVLGLGGVAAIATILPAFL